ncbi:MAG: CCA tRNA nucleotidyltransferase, partial [Clostridia bacterium]|nr:CCA tRNA nucleotidyltransferase [Clostridia bacterium]
MALPAPCQRILRRIREAGGEAYVVGGAVRDMLLGKNPGDYDMTTSLLPEETETLFA